MLMLPIATAIDKLLGAQNFALGLLMLSIPLVKKKIITFADKLEYSGTLADELADNT